MRIKVGIIGMGYIGVSHIEAIRRIGFLDLVAVADTNTALAEKKAAEYHIPRVYSSLGEMIEDPEIDCIHNCTPNNLHFEINKQIIEAGKHIFSEKPLARDAKESAKLVEILKRHPNVQGAVNFNYRANPLVQEMRQRIEKGDIGKVNLVHGSYLQDWLLYDTDYNWRLEPEIAGISRCIADIGSHWMDLCQHLTGSKITEVCSDLVTVIPVRKKPAGQIETFSVSKDGDYEERPITTEDYGAVLFKMANGAHGVFYVSEVSAGHGCFIDIELNGSKASLRWNQESADTMWMGFRDDDNRQIMRNPGAMHPEAAAISYLAKGHPEGWNDAFKNNIALFYEHLAAILEGRPTPERPLFATFEDADRIIKLTEAIVQSNKTRKWVSI